ncbi:MAG: hypothetical protein KDB22_03510 [Planctomycetales bacterium]|nr:hypothetical protein [Planctomycetales bacterium]
MSERSQLSDAEMEELEQRIFSARNYVVPSRELRPGTIELTKESLSRTRQARRLGLAAICCFALWFALMMSAPIWGGWRNRISAPFSAEIQQAAHELQAKGACDAHWGLVEVFSRIRGVSHKSDGTQDFGS